MAPHDVASEFWQALGFGEEEHRDGRRGRGGGGRARQAAPHLKLAFWTPWARLI